MLEEADKKILQAERQIKKTQQDQKETEAKLIQLFFKQDQQLRESDGNEREINQTEQELKNVRKQSEDLHKLQTANQKEIDTQSQFKLERQFQFVKKLSQQLSGPQKINQLSDYCEKYLTLHSFFNRFYRMDTEQQQIMNQMFLNEKIA